MALIGVLMAKELGTECLHSGTRHYAIKEMLIRASKNPCNFPSLKKKLLLDWLHALAA